MRIKQEHKIIILGFLLGASMWILDAVLDKFNKFPEVPFIQIFLYDAPNHEVWMRPIFLIAFTLSGVLIARLIHQVKRLGQENSYFFNSITDAILITSFTHQADKENLIEVNSVAVKLLGYSKEELLNLSLVDLTDPKNLIEIPLITQKLHDDRHLVFETVLVTKEGRKFPAEVSADIIEFREKPAVLALVRDISGRKKREAEIRRLASFPQLIPNPVLEVDTSGEITFCNQACYEIVTNLGEVPAAFLPKDLADILQVAVEKGEMQFQREVEVKDLLFAEMLYFARQYDSLRIFPIDITERRKAEEGLRESERQLRNLTTRLLEVQEDERNRITKELHDELGQSLLLLKLKLRGILNQLREDQGSLRQEGAQIVASVDSLIDNIRRLVNDLSPKIVEELGLTSAIRLLLEEFSQHYNNIGFDLVNFKDIDDLFPSPVQLSIYRIFQECLTNIGKHAEATQISCTVRKLEGRVWFSIKDDGRGFVWKDRQGRGNGKGGIGLSTMLERARWAGGHLNIRSQKGVGTEITFCIPYQWEGKNDSDALSNGFGR